MNEPCSPGDRRQGATRETGGEADGLVVEPTVLSDADNEMAAACNEHFGSAHP